MKKRPSYYTNPYEKLVIGLYVVIALIWIVSYSATCNPEYKVLKRGYVHRSL
jgi:hypothetical protein